MGAAAFSLQIRRFCAAVDLVLSPRFVAFRRDCVPQLPPEAMQRTGVAAHVGRVPRRRRAGHQWIFIGPRTRAAVGSSLRPGVAGGAACLEGRRCTPTPTRAPATRWLPIVGREFVAPPALECICGRRDRAAQGNTSMRGEGRSGAIVYQSRDHRYPAGVHRSRVTQPACQPQKFRTSFEDLAMRNPDDLARCWPSFGTLDETLKSRREALAGAR
jgi:hypothetical protein